MQNMATRQVACQLTRSRLTRRSVIDHGEVAIAGEVPLANSDSDSNLIRLLLKVNANWELGRTIRIDLSESKEHINVEGIDF